MCLCNRDQPLDHHPYAFIRRTVHSFGLDARVNAVVGVVHRHEFIIVCECDPNGDM